LESQEHRYAVILTTEHCYNQFRGDVRDVAAIQLGVCPEARRVSISENVKCGSLEEVINTEQITRIRISLTQ
jgi:hypothetical protein